MTTKDIDSQQNEIVKFQGFPKLKGDPAIHRQKMAKTFLSN
jgi:hypothetical protein